MLRSLALSLVIGSMLAVGAVAISSDPARADTPAPRVFKPDLLTIRAPAAKHGEPVSVAVIFHPEKGWYIDPDFPIACKLFLPEGVTADKRIFKNDDAVLDPHEGRLGVVLKPSEAGKKVIQAGLAFGVHDGTNRDIKIVKVSIEMDVE